MFLMELMSYVPEEEKVVVTVAMFFRKMTLLSRYH